MIEGVFLYGRSGGHCEALTRLHFTPYLSLGQFIPYTSIVRCGTLSDMLDGCAHSTFDGGPLYTHHFSPFSQAKVGESCGRQRLRNLDACAGVSKQPKLQRRSC